MTLFVAISDEALRDNIARYERDIEDLEARADRQRCTLASEGRLTDSEPLYQKLTCVRDDLVSDLRRAQRELSRRAADSVTQTSRSLGASGGTDAPKRWTDRQQIRELANFVNGAGCLLAFVLLIVGTVMAARRGAQLELWLRATLAGTVLCASFALAWALRRYADWAQRA